MKLIVVFLKSANVPNTVGFRFRRGYGLENLVVNRIVVK